MNIIDQFKQKDHFTNTENQVINYILLNKDNLIHLTINDLAKKTYSSNSTIIRICHKLGFEGYRDFKIAFLKELEGNKYIIKDVNYSIPFQQVETSEEIANSLFSLYSESLKVIQQQLDIKTLEDVSRRLMQSERIFIYAFGDAKITAKGFINKMIKINNFPILATENNEESYITNHITKNDCALFITYSAKNNNLEEYIQKLNKKGIKTIALTANEKSLLAKLSTYCLFIPNHEKDQKITTFYSQFGFLYILSLIYSFIYQFTGKQ